MVYRISLINKPARFNMVSYMEYRMALVLDMDPAIIAVRRESMRIPYQYAGRRRYYRPDFDCDTANQRLLVVEVKPIAKVRDPQNIAKFASARAFERRGSFDFLIATEELLYREPFWTNVKLARRYGVIDPPLDFIARTQTLLEQGERFRIFHLARLLGGDERTTVPLIYSMLYRGYLYFDLNHSVIDKYSWVELAIRQEANQVHTHGS